MIGISEGTKIMKRRLLTVFVLSFWANLILAFTAMYNPLPKTSNYYFFVFAPITGILFSLLITRRKYRLPRRYILAFGLTSFCIAASILAIAGPDTSPSANIAIQIITKCFIGIGWSASTYITITLMSTLYSAKFQILFAALQIFAIFGFAVGDLIANSSNDQKSVFTALAVVSGGLCLVLYHIPGDLSYDLTTERYTFLDYIKKSKQTSGFYLLGYVLACKAFVLFGIYSDLSGLTENSEFRLLGIFIELFGGFIGLFCVCFINLRKDRTFLVLLNSILYSFSFLLIGPWRVLFGPVLFLSILGQFVNSFLSYTLIVYLVYKPFYNSIVFILNFEALVGECVGAMYVFVFSSAWILGIVAALIFSTFTEFNTSCAVVGFICSFFGVIFYRKNRGLVLSNNVLETEAHAEPVDKMSERSKSHLSGFEEPVPEPCSMNVKLSKSSQNYEYNFLGIQSGYYSGEDFPSLPSNKECSAINAKMNISLPSERLKQVGDTILEIKNEEGSSDKIQELIEISDSEEKKVREEEKEYEEKKESEEGLEIKGIEKIEDFAKIEDIKKIEDVLKIEEILKIEDVLKIEDIDGLEKNKDIEQNKAIEDSLKIEDIDDIGEIEDVEKIGETEENVGAGENTENQEEEDNGVAEGEEQEFERRKHKYRTQPPIFKEPIVELMFEATVSHEMFKRSPTNSSHSSSDVIKDFKSLFPENIYENSI